MTQTPRISHWSLARLLKAYAKLPPRDPKLSARMMYADELPWLQGAEWRFVRKLMPPEKIADTLRGQFRKDHQ